MDDRTWFSDPVELFYHVFLLTVIDILRVEYLTSNQRNTC